MIVSLSRTEQGVWCTFWPPAEWNVNVAYNYKEVKMMNLSFLFYVIFLHIFACFYTILLYTTTACG